MALRSAGPLAGPSDHSQDSSLDDLTGSMLVEQTADLKDAPKVELTVEYLADYLVESKGDLMLVARWEDWSDLGTWVQKSLACGREQPLAGTTVDRLAAELGERSAVCSVLPMADVTAALTVASLAE